MYLLDRCKHAQHVLFRGSEILKFGGQGNASFKLDLIFPGYIAILYFTFFCTSCLYFKTPTQFYIFHI